MKPLNYSQLTEDDLVCIERGTVPAAYSEDLVRKTSDGKAIFSVRALKIYSAVCKGYGLQDELARIDSWESFAVLRQKIARLCTMRTDESLRQSLRAGRIPPQDRDLCAAILSDDIDQISRANMRRKNCLAAGRGVVPVGFRK